MQLKKAIIIGFISIFLLPCGLFAADHTVIAGGGGDYTDVITCMNDIPAGDRCVPSTGSYPGGSITT